MRNLVLLTAFLLPGVAPAQSTIESAEQERIERLEAAARDRDREIFQELKALTSAWRAERRRIAKAARAQRAAGKPESVAPERPALGPIARQYLAAAKEFATTDRAPLFLQWVILEGAVHDPDAARDALMTMARDHGQARELGDVIGRLSEIEAVVGAAATSEFVEALVEHGANPDQVARITLDRHAAAIEGAALDSQAYADARRALVAAAESGVSDPVADHIRGMIDQRETFGVGAKALDIAGVDLDGVAFALSDYHGKVVFLDFWGDW